MEKFETFDQDDNYLATVVPESNLPTTIQNIIKQYFKEVLIFDCKINQHRLETFQ